MKIRLEDYSNMPSVFKAAEVLHRHYVSAEQCDRVIDVAGDIIRSRQLLWGNQNSDFYVCPFGDFVKIDYRVDVSAKEAALMSFEMLDKLIEQNLVGLPFYVDFLGVPA